MKKNVGINPTISRQSKVNKFPIVARLNEMVPFISKLILMLMCLPLFYACSSDKESTDELMVGIHRDMSSELKNFASEQEELFNEAKFSSVTTRSTDNLSLDAKTVEKIGEKFSDFISKHDIYADLTVEEKKSLLISKDSTEMLLLDSKLALAYIKQQKSEEFYKIIKNLRKTGRIGLTQDEIIGNSELRINEKIQLIMALPLLNTDKSHPKIVIRSKSGLNIASVYTPLKARAKETESKEVKCKKEYDADISGCNTSFILEIGIAAATCYFSGGVGTAIASMEVVKAISDYDSCCKNAEKLYNLCIK